MLGNCNIPTVSNFKRNHPQTRLHSPSTSQHNVSRCVKGPSYNACWIFLHWQDVPLEGWNNLYIVACSFPSYHRILPFLASGGSALTATSDGFPLDCQAVLVHPENTVIQYWRYMGNTQLCDKRRLKRLSMFTSSEAMGKASIWIFWQVNHAYTQIYACTCLWIPGSSKCVTCAPCLPNTNQKANTAHIVERFRCIVYIIAEPYLSVFTAWKYIRIYNCKCKHTCI